MTWGPWHVADSQGDYQENEDWRSKKVHRLLMVAAKTPMSPLQILLPLLLAEQILQVRTVLLLH